MRRYVTLLRGVNVGGNNKLPMSDLRKICFGLGWQNVRTYIASGNVVFDTDEDPARLADDLKDALPLDISLLVLSADDLQSRLDLCPFSPTKNNLVHAYFCANEPVLDRNLIDLNVTSEAIEVIGKTLWLHTPDGFSKSNIAARIDKVLQTQEWTARNLNTVLKLVDMCCD